jgi:hypothetical protein
MIRILFPDSIFLHFHRSVISGIGFDVIVPGGASLDRFSSVMFGVYELGGNLSLVAA